MLTKKALFEILDNGNFTYVELFAANDGVNASSLRVRETGALTGEATSIFHKFRSADGAQEKFDLVQGWVYEWNNTHKPVEHKKTASVKLCAACGAIEGETVHQENCPALILMDICKESNSDSLSQDYEVLDGVRGEDGKLLPGTYTAKPADENSIPSEIVNFSLRVQGIQCPTVVKENGDELIAMQFTAINNIKQIFETPEGEQYVNLINSARRDCSKKSIEKRVLKEIKRQMCYYGCYDSLKNPHWGKTNKKEWARDVMRNLVVSHSQNIAFEFVKNRVFHYFGGWEYNLYQEIQKFYHAHVEYFDQIGYNLFWNSTDEEIFDLVDGEFDALFQH